MNYKTSTFYDDEPVVTPEQEAVLRGLNISQKLKDFILDKYPEVVPAIVSHQDMPPFDPKEQIVSFSAAIEGVTYLRYEKGKETFAMKSPYTDDDLGDYTEYCINDEIVFMEFFGEVVIKRVSASLSTKLARALKGNF